MVTSPKSALVPLLLASSVVSAQIVETVWSSVAFVYYGERTPLRGKISPSLTPYGAQQMLTQGSAFRSRYLSANTTLSQGELDVTTNSPIVGIERRALDNSQVTIFSNTDDYVSSSALAFMQGLYPPMTQSYAASNGGLDSAVLANGSLVNYPLNGYQYPKIQTLSVLDPNSVWIQGQAACTRYWNSASELRNDRRLDEIRNNTATFYQRVWSENFNGSFPAGMVNFDYAYDLYDYASYQYNHNATVRGNLTSGALAMLRELADIQQFELNGNLTASGLQKGDMIRAIGGRTLASKVVAQMQSHISSGGYSDKLTLIFGSFEPMLSFFSLSHLSNGHSSSLFQSIPEPGAAMILELFSTGNDTSSVPANDDLLVRFLYRNSSDESIPFLEYPLFGNGNSQVAMKWQDFISKMDQISISDLTSWCQTCDSVNLYCTSLTQNAYTGGSSSTGTSAKSVAPAVAGVIGAVVAVAIIGLATAAAILLGGVRINRPSDKERRNSTLGGFKGAEKLEDDQDVAIAKNGARHERTGSWELRGGGKSSETAPADTKITPIASRVRNADDDDTDSILGRAPVKPAEGV